MTDISKIHDALKKADLEYSALSCNGINIIGDRKSIDEVLRALHEAREVLPAVRRELIRAREKSAPANDE